MIKQNLLVILFLLIFQGLQAQSIEDLILKNGLGTEKIDTLAFRKLKCKLAEDNKIIFFTEDGAKISLELIGQSIFYKYRFEEKTIVISGNKIDGFKKVEVDKNSPIENHSEFHPNGTLKLIGKKSKRIEGVDTKGHPFMIGHWYKYDHNENLIETIEYDFEKSFLFTAKDVEIYVKKQNLDIGKNRIFYSKYPALVINGELKEIPKWIVNIFFDAINFKQIILDGHTGEKIRETINRIEK